MPRHQEVDFNVNHPIHDAIFGSDPDGFYNDTPQGAIGENVNYIGTAVQPETRARATRLTVRGKLRRSPRLYWCSARPISARRSARR